MECVREQDIVNAIATGRWQQACDRSLVEHAASCEICRDVVTVALALREDEFLASHDARLPSAGLVWWRAQIRARAEASRVAERPITVAQSIAGACAVGLAGGLAGAAWQSIRHLEWLGSALANVDAGTLHLASASSVLVQRALPLALGVGACLLIAPLAIYFVLSDD